MAAVSKRKVKGGSIWFPDAKLTGSSVEVLKRYGGFKVVGVYPRRKPVIPAIEKFMNVISLGGYERGKAASNYDKMFHLGVILMLENMRGILVEKNEKVFITDDYDNIDDEVIEVKYNGGATLFEFLENARLRVGDFTFYNYNSLSNNCQAFVNNLLIANNCMTKEAGEWIKQDLGKILKNLPPWVSKISQFVTDSYAKIRQIFGAGARTYVRGGGLIKKKKVVRKV